MMNRLTREEGLLVGTRGPTSWPAGGRALGPGKTVVTMLCDTGERYLSLAL